MADKLWLSLHGRCWRAEEFFTCWLLAALFFLC